tara:strand:+ start:734 stop:2608 length:1875 start_codon:yes stop_codon:yes gene_type:complete
MAVKSSALNVTDLDFDDISQNLKSYLKGQDSLKDYDFEGSTLSMLIDLLAYSSHIGAVNTNIAASELFLDSAQMRKNVVSRAKDLGFTPASETASTAIIDLTMNNVRNPDGTYPSANEMAIPAGTRFSTMYDGKAYNFVCSAGVTPLSNSKSFTYQGVNLKQGTNASDIFVYDRQIANPKFVLSQGRIDRTALTVSVNSGGVSTAYALASDISNILSTSQVYFTQENEDGFTEVYFGDGSIGAELNDGDIITVQYTIVDITHANGANTFTLTDAINGFSDSTVVVTSPAQGGAEKESVESIKFKATKFYSSQNRLVTLNDYKAKVSEYYPNADAVAVWGGEDNDPPTYGKVFVAIKPLNSDYLSDTEKTLVKQNLNKLNMITVRPEIVDAEIIKIMITTVFKYNEKLTDLTSGELETLVKNTIIQYDADNLNNFDSIFRHSNLLKTIDESDSSILSNISNVRLKLKKKILLLGQNAGITVDFGNPLYNPHSGHNAGAGGITATTGFYISGDTTNIMYFDDDGSGKIRRYYLSGSTRIYQDNEAGTITYGTGKISINSLNITSTVNSDNTIDFTLIPNSNDVIAKRGSLIDISSADIKVTSELDTVASGESSAGVGFTPTSTSTY